ncbi:MAG: GNAT family N-acetyltransferase [Nitriliruptorales bacterium]
MTRPVRLRTEERFPDGPLAEAWDRLVREDPAGTVFQEARFLRAWCRHLRGRCDLRLRFLLDGDEVVGVVPEVRVVRDGVRIARFAGGLHVTDYLGPVSLPEARERIISRWLDALREEDDWDRLVVAGVVEDAGWAGLIADGARARGWAVDGPERLDVCPRIDLRGGWDAYLGRLDAKQRHEIRRKARKLAREAGSVALVDVPVAELEPALEDFIAMHRTSPGEKGRFFADRDVEDFFRALAKELGHDATMRIHRLDLDGRPAAMTLSLVDHAEWAIYNSAFDQEWSGLAPGMVLVGEVIRSAADEGLEVLDLLRGDEPYKYRFGARDRVVQRARATRS